MRQLMVGGLRNWLWLSGQCGRESGRCGNRLREAKFFDAEVFVDGVEYASSAISRAGAAAASLAKPRRRIRWIDRGAVTARGDREPRGHDGLFV